jgi:hypothetical protein
LRSDDDDYEDRNAVQLPPNSSAGLARLVSSAVEGEIEDVTPTATLVVTPGKMVIEAVLNRLSFTHRYKPHPNFAQIIRELEAGRLREEVWPNGAAYEATTSYHAGLTTTTADGSGYLELHDFTDGMPLFVAAGQGAKFRVTIEHID